MKYITTIGENEYSIEIIDEHHVSVGGKVYEVDFHSISDQPVYSLLVRPIAAGQPAMPVRSLFHSASIPRCLYSTSIT